jgi:phage anti-repressor protein
VKKVETEGLKVVANEMLPVYETSNGDKVVNARELHEQLVVGKDFTHWIKDRIEKYGFVENEDYILTLAKIGERKNVTRHDYILTLDTAKEIAMVQNNEMGRAIRKYFIEVEKRFKQPKTQIEMLAIMAQQMVEQEKTNALRDQKITAIESSVHHITHNLIDVSEPAKVIERVNEYARYTRQGHDAIYNGIYQILKAKHGIDVKARVENERRKINAEHYQKKGKLYAESTLKQKVNGIDVMVRMEVLDKFNSILVGLLNKARGFEAY